ncbi:MAG: hypothetical protein EOP67_11455 [Sphingomonas sp.]|nr:MAG: hypothetical protein EOP67_11455 [Sphingomonas sp.]
MILVSVVSMLAAVFQEPVVPMPRGTMPVVPAAGARSASADGDGLSDEARIARASSLGRVLYTFDRAAWVSSDALMAAVPRDRLTGSGGYVVEQSGPDDLRVTYYRGEASTAVGFFVADVRAGKVVTAHLLAEPIALTAAQALLVRARGLAAETARSRAYRPCSKQPFNTVVLPPREDGSIAVYLLSPQRDAGTFPMGGHYRMIVGADGRIATSRPYSVACLDTPLPRLPTGATPVGLVVSSVLDPVPTEIHVFASYSLRMPVFVATRDKRLWKVTGSTIALTSVR